MSLFLDTADVVQIVRAIDLKLISGVTTNPKILAQDGVKNIDETLAVICGLSGLESVSVELLDPTKPETDLVVEALHYCSISDLITIKVPFYGFESLSLIKHLSKREININVTCLLSASQGILAMQQDPQYVSLFYNRMIDLSMESRYNSLPHKRTSLLSMESREKIFPDDIDRAYANKQIENLNRYKCTTEFDSKIICGSIRSMHDIPACITSGADIVTVTPKVLDEILMYDKTKAIIDEFTKAWSGKK